MRTDHRVRIRWDNVGKLAATVVMLALLLAAVTARRSPPIPSGEIASPATTAKPVVVEQAPVPRVTKPVLRRPRKTSKRRPKRKPATATAQPAVNTRRAASYSSLQQPVAPARSPQADEFLP